MSNEKIHNPGPVANETNVEKAKEASDAAENAFDKKAIQAATESAAVVNKQAEAKAAPVKGLSRAFKELVRGFEVVSFNKF